MEAANLIIPEQINSSVPVNQSDKIKSENVSEEKKKQIAKDFESLLLNQLSGQMKNTIGNWGFEKDSASSQIDGIFWLYLAKEIADNGGIGLWQDIYKSMPTNEQNQEIGQSMNGQI